MTNTLAYRVAELIIAVKRIVNTGPVTKGPVLKKLRIRNLHKMDQFHSKLLPFLLSVTFTGLDKHTSLLRNP